MSLRIGAVLSALSALFLSSVGYAGDEALPLLAPEPPGWGAGLLPSGECGAAGADPCPSGDPVAEGRTLLGHGALAPPFELPDPEGEVVSFRPGEDGSPPTLLVFWSLRCPPCREEMPLFADLALRYPSPELRVIAVNLDGPGLTRAVAQYGRGQNLPFPLAEDQRGRGGFGVSGAYGVTGTPTLVLVGRDGAVAWSHEGPADPLELEEAVGAAIR